MDVFRDIEEMSLMPTASREPIHVRLYQSGCFEHDLTFKSGKRSSRKRAHVQMG
jgi:hypothetical protein